MRSSNAIGFSLRILACVLCVAATVRAQEVLVAVDDPALTTFTFDSPVYEAGSIKDIAKLTRVYVARLTVDAVRERIIDGFRATGVFTLVERPDDADFVVLYREEARVSSYDGHYEGRRIIITPSEVQSGLLIVLKRNGAHLTPVWARIVEYPIRSNKQPVDEALKRFKQDYFKSWK
jgi:hypothetical protein